jgi:predicted nucleic acid-binding protein
MYELFMNPDMFLSEDGSYRPLCPVEDEFVAGEIVNRWFHREQARHLKDLHESEMVEFDAVLAELLFRMKQKLSRLGRNGQWSLWLRQQRIQRSTADRLVAQYAESHGLTEDLRHREIIEPLQGNVCLAASRVFKRLKNMLKTPRSRMTFIRVLGDLFQLSVDLEGGVDSVRLSIPPPVDADNPENYVVPPTIEMQDDGTVKPVDYELRDEEEDSVFYPDVRRSARPNTPREQDRNLGTEPSQ